MASAMGRPENRLNQSEGACFPTKSGAFRIFARRNNGPPVRFLRMESIGDSRKVPVVPLDSDIQQMRGSSSPPGRGSRVSVPSSVRRTTLPAISSVTVPITAAFWEYGQA